MGVGCRAADCFAVTCGDMAHPRRLPVAGRAAELLPDLPHALLPERGDRLAPGGVHSTGLTKRESGTMETL